MFGESTVESRKMTQRRQNISLVRVKEENKEEKTNEEEKSPRPFKIFQMQYIAIVVGIENNNK